MVLHTKKDISDGIGSPVLYLAVCLFVAWLCVFVSIIKGIKSSGKLSYVFAILPYVTLFCILIRACTLEGAWDGIKYFVYPGEGKWKNLLNLKVWFDATTQCFFSLTIGMGCIIMFSSYNKFDRNIYR
jgi:solute carrier family 6 (neurotransmitter transporter, glycine) member 5/9